MNWNDLGQYRDQWRTTVNMVINLQGSNNFGKFLCDCTTGSFSRMAQLHVASYGVVQLSLTRNEQST
jgi:hypothetical protein